MNILKKHPLFSFIVVSIISSFLLMSLSFADSLSDSSPMDADSLTHEIGKVITDNSAFHKKALYGDKIKDKYGNLVYGDVIEVRPGTYNMVFNLKTDVVTLPDVIANIGIEGLKDSTEGYYKEIYGRDIAVANTYKTVTLTFKIDKETTITPYIYMVGTTNLWIDSITLKKNQVPVNYTLSATGEYIYEEDELSRSVGSIINDISASNGKTISATPLVDKYGFLSFGPYSESEAPGNHQAIFRMKTDTISNERFIAKIEIFNPNGDGVNKFRKLRGVDFVKTNAFQDFPIEYTRTNAGSMEFKVLFYASGSVVLDHVRSKGEFIRKTPPKFSSFHTSVDQTNDVLMVSFISDEKLSANPVMDINGHPLSFSSKIGNNYNYTFSSISSLGDGIYPIKILSAPDYFGNIASNVILGNAEIVLKDTIPPSITNIILSTTEANSFESVRIRFSVNESLKEKPIIMIGNNPAVYVSGSGVGEYIFDYNVNDYSPVASDITKTISISVVDIHENTAVNTSQSLLLHINNSNLTEESEDLPGSVGEVVSDELASNKKARHGNPTITPTGYLQFGPYSDNITHNTFHVAKFRLKTQDNSSTQIYATIDVVNTNGDGEKVYKQIRGTDFISNDVYQDFELKFFRSNSGIMEYRIYFTGNGDITTDSVTITDPINTVNEIYESEDLFGVVGNIVNDSLASKGSAIKATVGIDTPGTFQFGPYRTSLKNGSSYTAKFRLKTDINMSTDPIALIDIYDGTTGYREYRELKATDFDIANTYQDFDIDFIKPTSENLEFRVFFYGKQNLWADKAEIIEIIKPKLPDYETENLPGISGMVIVDPDASGQLARKSRAGIDPEGAIQFGPYDATNLVDGQPYKAIFRMKVPDNIDQNFIALIDVYNSDTGYRKYREIKAVDFDTINTYQNFEINFTKPVGSKNMEYRVFFYGKKDLIVDKISVMEGIYEGLPVFESENLPSKAGVIIKDAGASGGKVLSFDKNRFAEGWTQFGPYKIDNVNIGENYKSNFILRTDDINNPETIAIINVFNSDKSINYNISIKGTDFSASNTFQNFFIDFPMLDKDLMEFRVFGTGKGNFSVDKVYLSK